MQRQRLPTLLLVPAFLCVVVASVGRADDQSGPAALPEHVEMVLTWLPVDTETLVVYSMPQEIDDRNVVGKGTMLTTSPVLKELDKLIGDQTISWAIHGGRNFEVVSAFGSLVQEGASVIRFAEEFSQERLTQIKRELGIQAERSERMEHRDVFVFPFSRNGVESYYQDKPWQGVFVVILDSRTIIKASSDRYLREMLARIDTGVTDRALPKELPEWKYVDASAVVWLLRHVPPPQGVASSQLRLQGLVWGIDQKNRFRATYLPLEGKSVDDIARRPWIDQETKVIPDDLQPLLSFEKSHDDVVTFTFGKFEGEVTEQLREQLEELDDSPHKGKILAFAMFYLYTSQGMKR